MRKVKSRLALLLAVIMIAGSLQLPVFAVRRSGAGIPSGASAEAGVEDPGQVTETELLDLVPDSAGTGGTEPQDPVDTTWTVIFDANGGTFPGGETQISLDVEKGLAVQFNSEPLTTADRYFAGWKTQDGTLINDAYSFVPENDITLYAFWKDKKKVENISLNHHELTMSVGKTAALSATVLPEDAYDRSFTWKSGNPGVAAVNNNGKVTAAAKGTAVIKAAANDGSGVFAECKITVRQPVTSLTLNKTSLTVNRGATATLTATVGPSNADNKKVKWTTSNSAVATVSSTGAVKGVKKGTATITATAADGSGKKAACTVTVKNNRIHADDVTGKEMAETAIDTFNVTELSGGKVSQERVVQMLFQTGFLTIRKLVVQNGFRSYTLKFPNREVRKTFQQCYVDPVAGAKPSKAKKEHVPAEEKPPWKLAPLICVLLALVTAVSIFFIVRMNEDWKEAHEQLAYEETYINELRAESETQEKDLESQLKEAESENSDNQSEIDDMKAEKESVEQDIRDSLKEIQSLESTATDLYGPEAVERLRSQYQDISSDSSSSDSGSQEAPEESSEGPLEGPFESPPGSSDGSGPDIQFLMNPVDAILQ